MQDDDFIIDELEAEPIQTNNTVEDLINHIQNKDYTDAENAFNDIIGDRLQDTLDQAKIRIADTMFNAQQELEDEPDLSDVEDDLDLDLDDYEEEEDDDSYLNDIG